MIKSKFNFRLSIFNNAFIFLYLLIYFVVLALKIIIYKTPFYDWDESLYIQSGLEMFKYSYFLFPVWQGMPWLDKPPLIPFLYASIVKIFYFVQPEISSRLFTLFIGLIVLLLLYIFYKRIINDNFFSATVVVITSLVPIFIQRMQVVNLDVFLLLGWIGYFVFEKNSVLSFIFLFIAVMSKSFVGFYPLFIVGFFYIILFINKKISKKLLIKKYATIIIQGCLISIWFIAMIFIFGNQFIKQHIIESHFNRITSSIEFHFGERLYYIYLVGSQFGWLSILAFLGSIIFVFKFYNDKRKLIYGFAFFLWFIFLNLTKTKIFWYIFPAIPQIAFFIASSSLFFIRLKRFFYIFLVLIICAVFIKGIFIDKVIAQSYSSYSNVYTIANYAKHHCRNVFFLENLQTRKSFSELEKMGLLITTTKWWGSRPSLVYYSGKKVKFLYNEEEFKDAIFAMDGINDCLVIEKNDKRFVKSKKLSVKFFVDPFFIFQ